MEEFCTDLLIQDYKLNQNENKNEKYELKFFSCMKHSVRTVLIVMFAFQSAGLIAQMHFEKGYFESNDGSITKCLIKNEDWYKTPDQFKYKLLTDENIQLKKIEEIKEFGIDNQTKYLRADVNVDISPSSLNELTDSRNPVWKKKLVFLKVLVEGKACLYKYSEPGLERFFYKVDTLAIEQLINKEFINRQRNTTAINDTFKIQLMQNLICESSDERRVEYPDYYEKDLVKYFITFNQCSDPGFKVIKPFIQRDILNISLFGGINSTSVTIENESATYYNADFKQELTYHAGAGIEYILPIFKNKWSVIMESVYNQFNTSLHTDAGSRTIDYKALSFSMYAKYYLFLNDQCKISIKGGLHSIYAYNFNSHYTFQLSYGGKFDYTLKEQKPDIGIGIGIEYRRLFAEFEYLKNHDIMSNNVTFSSKLNRLSFSVGYKIFKLSSRDK